MNILICDKCGDYIYNPPYEVKINDIPVALCRTCIAELGLENINEQSSK